MPYILIAFFAPLFYATAVIIESQLSNRTFKRQTTMIFYISLMNAVYLPLVLFLGMPSIPPASCLWFYALLALLDIIYLYPYYTAMKVIDTSIVAALFSLGEVIVPVLSYFLLDELLNLHQYIGFTIIILASVALSIKGNKIPKLNRGFYYMCIASVLVSFRIVLIKYVMNFDGNWINMVIYPSFISGILPFTLLFVKKYRRDIVKNFPPYLHRFKFFAVNEFMCFLGLVCSIYGLNKLSPVVSASIGATQPIFLLGISGLLLWLCNIHLKEKITPKILMKKIFCFVLIILGVTLVI